MAASKKTTVERGVATVPDGIRIGVQNARTQEALAEEALVAAFAEKETLTAKATGDIERDMIKRSADAVVEQLQKAVHAARVALTAHEDRLRRAEEAAARSADPMHVKFAELIVAQGRSIVATASDRLGVLVVVPADVTKQGHLYAGQAIITATGTDLSPYEWRAVMSWALPSLGDLRDEYGVHVGPDVTWPNDHSAAIDRLVVIDHEAERLARERRGQSMALQEALTKVGPGQAMQVQKVVEALDSGEDR